MTVPPFALRATDLQPTTWSRYGMLSRAIRHAFAGRMADREVLPETLQGKLAGQSLGSTCAEVLERHNDTEEVTGSNPVRPT